MKKSPKIIWTIIIFITILLIFTTKWTLETYNNASFEQIIFHITEPIKGVEKTILYDYLTDCLLITIIEFILTIYILKKILKTIKSKKNIILLKRIIAIIIICTILICVYKIGALEYIINGEKNSTFIEENYIDPKTVKITFPDNKRNLIYIYLESFESTYYSKKEGGTQKENLIPELYELSKNNISFSATNTMGGAIQIHGTSWTTAALVAQTSGIPLKMSKILTNNTKINSFLEETYTLGEILEKEGYNQTIMFGSDGNFGNRKKYFESNGNYKVYDYYTAIKNKKIKEDYYVWWGFEDSKLYEFAKEELILLSKENQPFNLTLLTSNTHHINGYLEEGCVKKHKNKYANVISCTSHQINEFINWCKKQDFYKNTTIIIVGDHLSMDPYFFKTININERRIFNLFINTQQTENKYNRKFSTIDMFPTTLASLGANIEGDRLALGANLFSNEKTIIEKYGLDYVNKELTYNSNFYNNKILGY